MSEIEKLIKADKDNIPTAKKVLDDFDTGLYDLFNESANLFQVVSRAFSYGSNDEDDLNEMTKIAEVKGWNEAEISDLFGGDTPIDEVEMSDELSDAYFSYFSRRARGLLVLHIYRSFMYAATDFLRMRVTSALGKLRVEIESAALINIFQTDKNLSYQWYRISDDKEGKKFFRDTMPKVNNFNDLNDLKSEWNLSSQAAQHSRLVGLIDGLSVSEDKVGNKAIEEYKLAFQDFNPETPEEFVMWALYILRVQAKLIIPLVLSLPEVTDAILIETRIPNFHTKLSKLYSMFENKYPSRVSKF